MLTVCTVSMCILLGVFGLATIKHLRKYTNLGIGGYHFFVHSFEHVLLDGEIGWQM